MWRYLLNSVGFWYEQIPYKKSGRHFRIFFMPTYLALRLFTLVKSPLRSSVGVGFARLNNQSISIQKSCDSIFIFFYYCMLFGLCSWEKVKHDKIKRYVPNNQIQNNLTLLNFCFYDLVIFALFASNPCQVDCPNYPENSIFVRSLSFRKFSNMVRIYPLHQISKLDPT